MTETLAELRDRIKAKYSTGVGSRLRGLPPAFVMESDLGRVVISSPVREVASSNEGFTYLNGRFVEADRPNRNGAYWTTQDLEMGQPSVSGGPLNWLHDDTRNIGAITGATLVRPRAVAKFFSADTRKKMASSGSAMPNGDYPIDDAGSLAAAIKLVGRSKTYTTAQVKAHIIKRARALGLTKQLPEGWGVPDGDNDADDKQKAAVDVGNHIAIDAVVWKFLFPREAAQIESASRDANLWFSMECVSRSVECLDTPGRPGCGAKVPYADFVSRAGAACQHLRERSSIYRFENPIFLGSAVIIPPISPGWEHADARVGRTAAQATEGLDLGGGRAAAMQLAEQILGWANSPH